MVKMKRGKVMYERFAEWLDIVLDTELPNELAAFCFNLYEEEMNKWQENYEQSTEKNFLQKSQTNVCFLQKGVIYW